MVMYKGRQPLPESGLIEKLKISDHDVSWIFYIKIQAHTFDWITCKLVADGKSENKANYWFSYNIKDDNYGFTRDLITLKKHRPELYEKLLTELALLKVSLLADLKDAK